MFRSTFSTTTIASSTTMPTASTRPKSDSVLMEKPKASMNASVPMMDTGTASRGITDARQVWRKSTTTMTTRSVASSSVFTTSWIDWSTKTVGSYTMVCSIPFGKLSDASSIRSRMPAASSSAFEPGDWKITIATAGSLSSMERSA